MLYTVHGDFGEVSSLAIDAEGALTRMSEISTHGRNPVHLALTPSARWMLVANYATGTVVSLRVAADGALGSVTSQLKLPGEAGPHPQQDGAHPHQICFTPDGRFAMVPDKGLDKVFALVVNEDTGHLRIAAQTNMPIGSGPRHMVFHDSRPLAYVVGELDRTVIVAHYDQDSGVLTPSARQSSVPDNCVDGTAAGIVLSPDARTLHVSNRGHDSVASFQVAGDGTLSTPSWTAAGRTPRFICVLPTGGRLLVAREEGHSLAVLGPPAGSSAGEFKDVAQTGSPVCVVFRKATP
jgi:6-phosphogluconolactonase (cycloisomerase 2 family)